MLVKHFLTPVANISLILVTGVKSQSVDANPVWNTQILLVGSTAGSADEQKITLFFLTYFFPVTMFFIVTEMIICLNFDIQFPVLTV